MNKLNYTCPKCGHKKAETDTIRTTGSGFSRYFNVQNRNFTAVGCTKCGFTELFRQNTGKLSNVLDFITN